MKTRSYEILGNYNITKWEGGTPAMKMRVREREGEKEREKLKSLTAE